MFDLVSECIYSINLVLQEERGKNRFTLTEPHMKVTHKVKRCFTVTKICVNFLAQAVQHCDKTLSLKATNLMPKVEKTHRIIEKSPLKPLMKCKSEMTLVNETF